MIKIESVLTGAVIVIAQSFISGIMLAHYNKKQKKKEKIEDEEEKRRQKSESLKLSLSLAGVFLARAVAHAYKRGTPNGEMEDCLAECDKIIAELRDFEREQITKI